MADALSRLAREGHDTSQLDEDISVLAVETRARKETSPEGLYVCVSEPACFHE